MKLNILSCYQTGNSITYLGSDVWCLCINYNFYKIMLLVQILQNQKSLFGVYPGLSVISTYTCTGIENYIHHCFLETFYLLVQGKYSFLTCNLIGFFNLFTVLPCCIYFLFKKPRVLHVTKTMCINNLIIPLPTLIILITAIIVV